MTAIYIFTRDLRIEDNKTLIYADLNFEQIIPIFIFTPEQIGAENKFRSCNAIQFMSESLINLDQKLHKLGSKLHFFYGNYLQIIDQIINYILKKEVQHIIITRDYTPYATQRQNDLDKWCKKIGIQLHCIEDYLLCPMGQMLKEQGQGDPYTVYTPFRNNGFKLDIDQPSKDMCHKFITFPNLGESMRPYDVNKKILLKGGRTEGLKQLKKLSECSNYNNDRNLLSKKTSLLSAYIKFGCLSIREVYWKMKQLQTSTNQDLVSQLFWREFYFYIAFYFPQVLAGKNYNPKYNTIKWSGNKEYLEHWKQGTTGYPVVDAGMIELKTTGYMHNRARLITANFLNRLLGIDWRWGEQYYATQLTDYDPCVNNGNWQWVASTGVDPKPFNQRLFNPWLQSKKYDPEAEYIKKWLPQLKDIPAKELHQWDKYYQNYDLEKIKYQEPIVNYEQARKLSLEMYRNI